MELCVWRYDWFVLHDLSGAANRGSCQLGVPCAAATEEMNVQLISRLYYDLNDGSMFLCLALLLAIDVPPSLMPCAVSRPSGPSRPSSGPWVAVLISRAVVSNVSWLLLCVHVLLFHVSPLPSTSIPMSMLAPSSHTPHRTRV